MVSILIPTYNYNIFPLVKILHEQCVALLIPFEIRVIEDASIKLYSENATITSFRHTFYKKLESNVGRTKTRNILAKEATYDTLLFLDADVIPVRETFVKKYLKELNADTTLIFGGVEYSPKRPEKAHLLRWVYGHKRESKIVFERNKNPFYIISQNILIQKNIFLEVNKHLDNRYGMDNVFSFQLQKNKIKVKHIENPVYHNGLEKSEVFLKKSLLAVETLVDQELKNNINTNFTTLQKFYLKLKKMQVHIFIYKIIEPFIPKIEQNLCSNKPRIILLDFYKLHHYMKLKHGK